jgi:hypothetical protein
MLTCDAHNLFYEPGLGSSILFSRVRVIARESFKCLGGKKDSAFDRSQLDELFVSENRFRVLKQEIECVRTPTRQKQDNVRFWSSGNSNHESENSPNGVFCLTPNQVQVLRPYAPCLVRRESASHVVH